MLWEGISGHHSHSDRGNNGKINECRWRIYFCDYGYDDNDDDEEEEEEGEGDNRKGPEWGRWVNNHTAAFWHFIVQRRDLIRKNHYHC